MIKNNEIYLITTDGWFIAPDGQQYRAVWGRAKYATTKEVMGFNPTHSTNWFVKVGIGEGSILIAGCQINYVIQRKKKPEIEFGYYKEKITGKAISNNDIYIPEDFKESDSPPTRPDLGSTL